MKVTYRSFTGINNVDNPEKVGLSVALNDQKIQQDEMVGGREFVEAMNVDSCNDGTIKRRVGYSQVRSGDHHSLIEYRNALHYCSESNLYEYPNRLIDSGLGRNVRYAIAGDRLFYTDKSVVKVYDGKTSRIAGVPIPTKPTLSLCSGALPKGLYQIAITYQIGDEESGAMLPQTIIVESGGIRLTLPTNHPVNIYCSHAGGEALYRVAQTTQNSYDICNPTGGAILDKIGEHPPAGGQEITTWNGRLFIATGEFLLWSDIYRYESFDAMRRSLSLDSPITMIGDVGKDFLIVGTDKQIFRLEGNSPDKLSIVVLADVGALPYSFVKTNNAETTGGVSVAGIFLSTHGIMTIAPDGGLQNISVGKYKYSGTIANPLYRPIYGNHQAIWTLH